MSSTCACMTALTAMLDHGAQCHKGMALGLADNMCPLYNTAHHEVAPLSVQCCGNYHPVPDHLSYKDLSLYTDLDLAKAG